eukprot:TRINITY_DN24622_c0_g1_i2.p1 TRINITY_DN24622_c0_g1~~TRINITY_DN24622_c0_g1_i2.p1  ORF type:complete len:882 (-),score=167.16 TRINITY_DN24622_c0_g1_i2:52-2697(-)
MRFLSLVLVLSWPLSASAVRIGEERQLLNATQLIRADRQEAQTGSGAVDPVSIATTAISGLTLCVKAAELHVQTTAALKLGGIVDANIKWMQETFTPIVKEDKAVLEKYHSELSVPALEALAAPSAGTLDIVSLSMLSAYLLNIGESAIDARDLVELVNVNSTKAERMHEVWKTIEEKQHAQVKEVRDFAADQVKSLLGAKSLSQVVAKELTSVLHSKIDFVKMLPGINLVQAIVKLIRAIADLYYAYKSCSVMTERWESAAKLLQKDVLYEHCVFLRQQTESTSEDILKFQELDATRRENLKEEDAGASSAWEAIISTLQSKQNALEEVFNQRCGKWAKEKSPAAEVTGVHAGKTPDCAYRDESGSCCALRKMTITDMDAAGQKIPSAQTVLVSGDRQNVQLLTRHGRNLEVKGAYKCPSRFGKVATHVSSLASYSSSTKVRWMTNAWTEIEDSGWSGKLFLAVSSRVKLPKEQRIILGPFEARSYTAVEGRRGDSGFDAGEKNVVSADKYLYLLRSTGGLGAPIVSLGLCQATSKRAGWSFVLPLMVETLKCPDVRYSTWGTADEQLCYHKDFSLKPPSKQGRGLNIIQAELRELRDTLEQALKVGNQLQLYKTPRYGCEVRDLQYRHPDLMLALTDTDLRPTECAKECSNKRQSGEFDCVSFMSGSLEPDQDYMFTPKSRRYKPALTDDEPEPDCVLMSVPRIHPPGSDIQGDAELCRYYELREHTKEVFIPESQQRKIEHKRRNGLGNHASHWNCWCSGRECGKRDGKDYAWCWTGNYEKKNPKSRGGIIGGVFVPQSKSKIVCQQEWDYCVQDSRETSTSLGRRCVGGDKKGGKCNFWGKEYGWCYTTVGSWDYCSVPESSFEQAKMVLAMTQRGT